MKAPASAADRDAGALPAPSLECFRIHEGAPAIVGARSPRAWMDATAQRFAYRCTPMTVANASGWELLLPFSFTAEWDGGDSVEAITVHSTAPGPMIERLLASHFGHGILTFHPGWLFRTPPGWAVWARGAPNAPKDGIMALDGLVETDWLPFSFTMNWRFLRPGRVTFTEGEAFCFITLAPHGVLDGVAPVARELADDPELDAAYKQWSNSRNNFNGRLRNNDPEATKERWQRHYLGGNGAPDEAHHITKRKLRTPS